MRERRKYFAIQRLVGLCLLIFTGAFFVLVGDLTISLLTVPLGVSLLCSKKMLIVNNYYFENGGDDQWL